MRGIGRLLPFQMTEKSLSRTVIVPVRFTVAECALLDGGAGGSTRSDYIRWRTLDRDSPPPPRRRGRVPVEDHKALSAAMAKLGQSRIPNNLNQLARATHAGSLVLTPDIEAELREAVQHIAEIRRMIVAALGLSDCTSPPGAS